MADRKPKRRPGRPRSATKPEGLDRTACAHHFNVPVKTVDKWLRAGAPCTRHNGRVYFDANAVAEWREDYEAEQREPGQAQVLHPSDPRFIEKEAAAKVKLYEHMLETGNMVAPDPMRERVRRDFADLNSQLNTLPAIVGDLRLLNCDNAERILSGAMQHILADLKTDHPSHFPEPRERFYEDAGSDEFEERSYMPVLPASDPRAAVSRVNAQRHLAEWKRLESSCVTVFDAQAMMTKLCDKTRARLRALPKRVAARLAPDGNAMEYVLACINFELDTAKIELGSSPAMVPDPDGGEDENGDLKMVPFPPVEPVSLDSDKAYEDERDGDPDEFEPEDEFEEA